MTDRAAEYPAALLSECSHMTPPNCSSPEAFPSGVVISIITCVGSDAWDRLVVIKTRIVLFIRELL